MHRHARRRLPGRGQDGMNTGASALHKSNGGRLGCGGLRGQLGGGCSAVPLLQGDAHEKGRFCPCLSFPPGKGQFNCLVRRGTES